MNIAAKTEGGSAVLTIQGRIDTITAPQLERAIEEQGDGITALTLDMGGVDYISSAGLRVLLTAQKKMNRLGSMKLCRVCEDVMNVLEMTGFADILTIE